MHKLENTTEELLVGLIKETCLKEFGELPRQIDRMKVGSINEVYVVRVGEKEYIVRLNKSPESLKGSSKYIPLFKSIGIVVPEIISTHEAPEGEYSYQIQTKLKGTDVGNIIGDLKEEQLVGIAKEISSIIKRLLTLPTNGEYGYVGAVEKDLKPSWLEVVEEIISEVKNLSLKNGVIDEGHIKILEKVANKYFEYFSRVPSRLYFEDMNSKNVMIEDGKFYGLVDLDGVMYGDYLEGVGRIKASWYGTRHGNFYTEAIENELGLSRKEREVVTVYALINKISWLSEQGVEFNNNTSSEVDINKVEKDKAVINALVNELNLQCQ